MAINSPLAALLENTRTKHILKGQVILYVDDVSPDVLILKSGIVKMHDIDEQGNEKILHLLKPPAIMPLAFFSGEQIPIRWFYTALTDCEVYVLPQPELLAHMQTDGALAISTMRWFSSEVHEILTRLSSLGKTNVRDKLIAALKFLVVCHGVQRRSGWWRIPFPVSHQLLADMTGVTRESAALTMKELQNELLVRNPRLTILEVNFTKLCEEQPSNAP